DCSSPYPASISAASRPCESTQTFEVGKVRENILMVTTCWSRWSLCRVMRDSTFSCSSSPPFEALPAGRRLFAFTSDIDGLAFQDERVSGTLASAGRGGNNGEGGRAKLGRSIPRPR